MKFMYDTSQKCQGEALNIVFKADFTQSLQ
jgi:hypothetical protein